ncbi:MAG: hypothetical protein PHQ11_11125 [Paludibacter sp.]|nr:hypothetical protein [Paludibacter sp.]
MAIKEKGWRIKISVTEDSKEKLIAWLADLTITANKLEKLIKEQPVLEVTATSEFDSED